MAIPTKITRQDRDQWSSEPAFVFSMAGAAVGLGNLWRFPYIMGEHGGAAFIIAYLTCLVVVVLPMMMMEVGAGRLAAGSTVHTYRQVNRFGTVYGWFVVLLTTAITSYYLVITGWTLGYAMDAWRGDLREFDEFSGGYNSLWFFLAVIVLATLVLIRGVRGIEKLSKVLMPCLLLLIIGLVFVAMRQPGWDEAWAFMTRADFSRLLDERLWFFAFGQSLYTLAIGQGYLVTYGSYIPRKTNVPRACLIVACVETSVALLAALLIFPFVFSVGAEPDEGSALAFSILPGAFEELRGGAILAILFFTLFFFAAFSPSIAGLKVIISAVSEELRMPNRNAVLVVAAIMIVLGTPSALSYTPLALSIGDRPFLDFMDQIGGTNMVIFSSVLGVSLFCWFVPQGRLNGALGAKSNFWIWRIYTVGKTLPFLVVGWFLWTLLF